MSCMTDTNRPDMWFSDRSVKTTEYSSRPSGSTSSCGKVMPPTLPCSRGLGHYRPIAETSPFTAALRCGHPTTGCGRFPLDLCARRCGTRRSLAAPAPARPAEGPGGADAVEVRQRRGQGRNRHAGRGRVGDRIPQSLLPGIEGILEESDRPAVSSDSDRRRRLPVSGRRNLARMMQPYIQILATSPSSVFQPYSCAPAAISWKPCT